MKKNPQFPADMVDRVTKTVAGSRQRCAASRAPEKRASIDRYIALSVLREIHRMVPLVEGKQVHSASAKPDEMNPSEVSS